MSTIAFQDLTGKTPDGYGYSIRVYDRGGAWFEWHPYGGCGSVSFALKDTVDPFAVHKTMETTGTMPVGIAAI